MHIYYWYKANKSRKKIEKNILCVMWFKRMRYANRCRYIVFFQAAVAPRLRAQLRELCIIYPILAILNNRSYNTCDVFRLYVMYKNTAVHTDDGA